MDLDKFQELANLLAENACKILKETTTPHGNYMEVVKGAVQIAVAVCNVQISNNPFAALEGNARTRIPIKFSSGGNDEASIKELMARGK